jgi:hypothetical protein
MRCLASSLALLVLCIAPVAADLTITVNTSIEGAMLPAAGGDVVTKIVTRIKGTKSRTDVELDDQTVSAIVDYATQQTIVLRPEEKTAYMMDVIAPPDFPAAKLPEIETTVKPTGQSREIEGASCEEYAVSMKLDLASMTAGRGSTMPPEAAAMMKDVRMRMIGSVWVSKAGPGVSEYAEFQKAAAKSALGAFARGGSGIPAGMDRLISGFAEAPGIPYLTDITMSFEGSGKMAAMMKQMGETKIVSRVSSVSTDPLDDTLFTIPEGYTVTKH